LRDCGVRVKGFRDCGVRVKGFAHGRRVIRQGVTHLAVDVYLKRLGAWVLGFGALGFRAEEVGLRIPCPDKRGLIGIL
jgi:hypothetical protein